MTKNVMSLTRSGLLDWLVQRFSSVIMAAYVILLIGFILSHPQLSYADWKGLFANPVMRIFSFLVLLNIVAHAWVGMWTVFTDYIKPVPLRLFLEVAMVLVLLAYLVWGVEMMWGL